MQEIKTTEYLKLYENSVKTELFCDYVLVTAKRGEGYVDTEVLLGNSTISSIIDSHTDDIAKVVFYSRPIGLFDDIEVYGPITNIGKTIYFGERMSVAEANALYHKDIDLDIDSEVIVLENGDVITDIEEFAETHYEVKDQLSKIGLS